MRAASAACESTHATRGSQHAVTDVRRPPSPASQVTDRRTDRCPTATRASQAGSAGQGTHRRCLGLLALRVREDRDLDAALDVGVHARLRDHRQPVLTRDVHGGDATEPERCLERRVRLRATPRKPAQNSRSQHLHRRRQRGLRLVLEGSTNSGHVSQSIVRVCSG
jgi:hypothetical protein